MNGSASALFRFTTLWQGIEDMELTMGMTTSILPGEENGNPLQYYGLENSMDRGPGKLQSMGSQRVGHD